jgi:hypothetical protein
MNAEMVGGPVRRGSDIRGLFALAIIASATGCSEWPRSGHLPEEGTYLAPGDPPRATAQWAQLASDVGSDFSGDPAADVQHPAEPLTFGMAPSVYGQLDGVGWQSEAAGGQPVISGSNLSPSDDDGFYAHDIDLISFSLAEDSFVCGGATISPTTAHDAPIAWDFVLFDIDGDGIWTPHVNDAGKIVGSNLSGKSSGWGENLTAGNEYGLMMASYFPSDEDEQPLTTVFYEGGVAVYAPFDGKASACPQLPEPEVSE